MLQIRFSAGRAVRTRNGEITRSEGEIEETERETVSARSN